MWSSSWMPTSRYGLRLSAWWPRPSPTTLVWPPCSAPTTMHPAHRIFCRSTRTSSTTTSTSTAASRRRASGAAAAPCAGDVFLRHGGFDTERYGRPCIEDIELGYRVTRSGLRIRLVKALQVKHLKRWTVMSLLRSDILDRGIPWTRLLLREKAFANDLNLQTHNRLSVATTWLLALCLVMGFVMPWLWLIAAGAAGLLLALNWPVYRWFAGKRGLPFALAVIPWHWLYYFYNGVSFAAGLGAHLLDRRAASGERSPVNQPVADASQSADAESAGA